MPAARTSRPRHTPGTRICRLCWKTAPLGVEMFIVVGMGEDPLLVCPRCADTVLELRPDGTRKEPGGGEALQTESLFDQLKETFNANDPA